MFFVSLLQTQQAQPTGLNLMSLAPILIVFVIFYFFIIRPQNKRQKETEKMINALKKGDKVVTIGGIHGVVTSTKEKTVVVKVDSSTSIEFNRTAISTVIVDKPAEKKSKSKKDDRDEVKAEEAVKAEESQAEAAEEASSENK
jgi:preprotein translocase subunit YajC